MLVSPGSKVTDGSEEIWSVLRCFGDDDMVVMVVVAVGGRSFNAFDIAAFEEFGSAPVSSSLRSLDFISSWSSETVYGSVVDTVDSVPAARAIPEAVACP